MWLLRGRRKKGGLEEAAGRGVWVFCNECDVKVRLSRPAMALKLSIIRGRKISLESCREQFCSLSQLVAPWGPQSWNQLTPASTYTLSKAQTPTGATSHST